MTAEVTLADKVDVLGAARTYLTDRPEVVLARETTCPGSSTPNSLPARSRRTSCCSTPEFALTQGPKEGNTVSSVLPRLGWVGIAVLGAIALGLVASSRGETINAVWLVVARCAST
jgi:hypothetical protein